MQTINFLRNFFTKELEIHYSFYRIFLDFSVYLKFENLIFENFQHFEFSKLKNHQILNLKITEFQTGTVDPTTAKITSLGAFRIVL
jgi:hypothetical protein